MVLALIILVCFIAGGLFFTYTFSDSYTLFERIVTGVFLGTTIGGYVGFLLSRIFGFSWLTLFLAAAITLFLPLVYVVVCKRSLLLADCKRTYSLLYHLRLISPKVIVLSVALIFFSFFVFVTIMQGAAFSENGMIFTRSSDNVSDLTLHVGIITGFVYGENVYPEHPDFAGSKLTYPFIVDLVTAMLVKAGLSLTAAILWVNCLLCGSLIILLGQWSWRLTGSKFVAYLTPAIILLSGGVGFLDFFKDFILRNSHWLDFMWHLPSDYTHVGSAIRWGNPLVYWLIPMRSMMLGIPLSIIITSKFL